MASSDRTKTLILKLRPQEVKTLIDGLNVLSQVSNEDGNESVFRDCEDLLSELFDALNGSDEE